MFLAVVLDLASRRVVGWAMRESMDVTRPLAALDMAFAVRGPAAGVLHHADRGSQYGRCEFPQVRRISGEKTRTAVIRR